MRLIAFTGLPRSGKDSAADWLALRYQYRVMRFSDPLKEAAAILLGRPVWQMQGGGGFDREAILPEWGFSTRYFLQRFGTEAIRDNFGADFWVKKMRHAIRGSNDSRIAISDCRFENEAAMVRELGGIVVQVWRPGVEGSSHASDAGVIADLMLFNDGTLLQLRDKVNSLIANGLCAEATR